MPLSENAVQVSTRKTKKELLKELEKARGRIAALENLAGEESETHTRAILDNLADGVVTIDARGRIRSFNPAAAAMFGFTADEAIGQNVSILMPEYERGAHDGHLSRYLETGESKILGVGPGN